MILGLQPPGEGTNGPVLLARFMRVAICLLQIYRSESFTEGPKSLRKLLDPELA